MEPTLYLYGFLGSTAVAALAWWRGSLTSSGALGAVAVGTLVTGNGWGWAALLLLFFVSSSALSHWGGERKRRLAGMWEKGARRDLGQVLANGGVAAALAAVYANVPDERLFLAFAGTLAAVNADTWATEIGVLGGPPRLITTWQPAERGVSGAVSGLGSLAALAGAAAIGLAAWICAALGGVAVPVESAALVLVPTAAGVLGAFADSMLGATLQAAYRCPACRSPTERRRHACGALTERVRGLPWLGNDMVNLLAAIAGAAIAGLTGSFWV